MASRRNRTPPGPPRLSPEDQALMDRARARGRTTTPPDAELERQLQESIQEITSARQHQADVHRRRSAGQQARRERERLAQAAQEETRRRVEDRSERIRRQAQRLRESAPGFTRTTVPERPRRSGRPRVQAPTRTQHQIEAARLMQEEPKRTIFAWEKPSDTERNGRRAKYEVLLYADGSMSCDCPGWIFHRKGEDRGCKHTAFYKADAIQIHQTWLQTGVLPVVQLDSNNGTIGRPPKGDTEPQRTQKKTPTVPNDFGRIVELDD